MSKDERTFQGTTPPNHHDAAGERRPVTVTILAIVFILVMISVAVFGYKAVIKQGKAPEDINKERCSICRQQFHKSQLVERQIGDYRLYFFCPTCIQNLYNDLISKN